MVLYSAPVVMEDFEPYEIPMVFEYLSKWSPRMNTEIKRVATGRKRSLRQVCKAWKQIIDTISPEYPPIRGHRFLDTEGEFEANHRLPKDEQRPKILETCRYPTILAEVTITYATDVPIKIEYTHPVSALTLQISRTSDAYNGFAYMESISNILSFPNQLRTLSLDIPACKGSVDLLKDLQKPSISLTTLSLFLEDSHILQTCLSISTLVNLFVSITRSGKWRRSSRFKWTLPALRNLYIIERNKDPTDNTFIVQSSTHPFFIELLRNHSFKLQSLIIHPMTKQISDEDSPLCWKNMPNLKALTTDFSDKSGPTSHHWYSSARNSHLAESTSVLDLTQFNFDEANSAFVAGLQKCICACPKLKSVTMINVPNFHGKEFRSTKYRKKIIKLLKLCDERNITVWEQDSTFQPRRIVSTKLMRR